MVLSEPGLYNNSCRMLLVERVDLYTSVVESIRFAPATPVVHAIENTTFALRKGFTGGFAVKYGPARERDRPGLKQRFMSKRHSVVHNRKAGAKSCLYFRR